MVVFYSDFLARHNRKLSEVEIRYKKIVGDWEFIESGYYTYDSRNNNLESEI